MEKVFRPTQTKSTLVWSIILLTVIDVPFFVLFFFSFQGFSLLFIILAVVLILVDSLILYLGLLGKRMNFRILENDFLVNFGFSRRRIPFSSIKDLKLSKTNLRYRLFGASWPGLHWGLFKTKDIGKVWVYSTKMSGEFVVIELVDGNKVAVSPENPEQLFDELNSQRSRFGTSSISEGFKSLTKFVYLQVASVATAFFVFLGYILWIYPLLPEIIPVHFDFNMIPNRWGHKSELFIIAGIATIFPIINSILVLKFGRYGKGLVIFLGIVFVSVMALFFGIVYYTQSVI